MGDCISSIILWIVGLKMDAASNQSDDLSNDDLSNDYRKEYLRSKSIQVGLYY
jgi:hypothetical protein